MALQAQRSGRDEVTCQQLFGDACTGIESLLYFVFGESADRTRHGDATQVTVRRKLAGWLAPNTRVVGQVNGIGNDGGGRVREGCAAGQNGDGVCDAERKTASMPSTGRDAAARLIGSQRDCAEEGRTVGTFDHAGHQLLTGTEVKGDVAAVVHIRARQV